MQFKLIHYEMLKMNFGIRWLKTCLQSCQFSAVGIFLVYLRQSCPIKSDTIIISVKCISWERFRLIRTIPFTSSCPLFLWKTVSDSQCKKLRQRQKTRKFWQSAPVLFLAGIITKSNISFCRAAKFGSVGWFGIRDVTRISGNPLWIWMLLPAASLLWEIL